MRQQTCLLVVVLLVTAVVAQAQQARQGHRIGVLLYDGAPPGLHDAFGEGLRELGYEGKTITLEWRDAHGSGEQLAALAEDLVRLKVDLILAVNTPAALAAKAGDHDDPHCVHAGRQSRGIRRRRESGPSRGQCDRRQFDARRVQRQTCRVRQRDPARPRARGGAL